MTCKIRNLGLAIVAVAAMSMTAASAAQASELHATHNSDVVVTGQQVVQHQLHLTHEQGGPGTTCNTVSFEGTMPWVSGGQVTTNELTLTPTYAGCQSVGLAATVRMNGCKYTITGKQTQGSTTALTAYLDITGCTPGKLMEVISGGGACVITVAQQHHLQHIIFSNTTEAGKPHHTHANITITGIKYETHGALCGHTATKPRTDAQYVGQATFRAYKKTGQHKIAEHGHQFDKQTHSSEQVGLLAT